MKKFSILLLSFIIFSCSINSKVEVDPYANYLLVDYDVDFNTSNSNTQIVFNDLTILPTNDVFLLLDNRTNNKTLLSKVSANGTKSEILDNLVSYLGGGRNITSALNDKLFFNSNPNRNKIYNYDNVQLNSYSMANNLANFDNIAQITTISRFTNNLIVAFDNNNKTLKLYSPQNNLETTIAGSGNNMLTDGTGTSASFKSISKIICKNNKIYVIDDLINLRKIEYINNSFTVTTLISNYDSYLRDMAVDANGDIYVTVLARGIMKLNTTTNTLEIFKNGYVNTKTQGNANIGSLSWESGINAMYIKENDLYVINGSRLVKISDFKTKI